MSIVATIFHCAIVADMMSGSNVGAAYVYIKTGASKWELATELIPVGTSGASTFGSSAAILGSTIVVGANGNGE